MASRYSSNQQTGIPIPGTLLALLPCLLLAACQVQNQPRVPSAAQLDCENWNTDEFFQAATGADVRRCLRAGARANARDEHSLTPLHRAGSAAIVRLLIEAGADIHARNEHGATPLHEANSAGIARALLAAGAPVSAREDWGRTPLHRAVDDEVVHLLLEAGADISAVDREGRTALHFAVLEAAKALVQSGADVNARDRFGNTPLHEADVPALIELYASAGAEPDAANSQGVTPLHRACRFKFTEVVEKLIDAGADVNARDKEGNTPLHEASAPDTSFINWVAGFEPDPDDLRKNEANLARLLLAHGANPRASNEDGETPLHMAAKASNELTIRLLLEAGADVRALDR